MLFGKHINRYYLRHALAILLGIMALIVVDVLQLKVPEFYRMVVNGLNDGSVSVDGTMLAFDMDFLLDKICLPMIFVILLWSPDVFCGEFVSSVPALKWKPISEAECSITVRTFPNSITSTIRWAT